MSTTYGTCALQFPSNYVLMDTEEMEYLDGGAGIKRSTVAAIIDTVAIIYTFGQSLATVAAVRAFIKANKNKILYQVGGKLTKIAAAGTVTTLTLSAALNVALTLSEFSSLGGLIAAGIDYVDGNYNGYCFG